MCEPHHRASQREILADGVLGAFTAHRRIEIVDGNRRPAELLGRPQPALAGDQLAVGPDDDRLQQARLVDAGREPGDVAQVATMAFANDDFVDAAGRRLRVSGACVTGSAVSAEFWSPAACARFGGAHRERVRAADPHFGHGEWRARRPDSQLRN
jgi:hypothetical protein